MVDLYVDGRFHSRISRELYDSYEESAKPFQTMLRAEVSRLADEASINSIKEGD